LIHSFDKIISVENLLLAWQEFIRGKRKKKDVQEFQLHLIDNILILHEELKNKTYKHGGYYHFRISDPKPRDIHKASVKDRLTHHAIYRVLYPYFDRKFIADSYSCRKNKGTHKAFNRFRSFSYKVSKNHTRTCWVLKCDIKKFFASIDHKALISLLCKAITDENTIWLLKEIIVSFCSTSAGMTRHTSRGLPLGNLTSQLLVNIYMNEFDQFIKHKLRIEYYIRYADDFIFLSEHKSYLENLVLPIKCFLLEKLKLELHPKKVFIKTIASGVDFLGWVHFSNHRVLRTSTKRRMMKRLRTNPGVETRASYFGLLKHGNGEKLKRFDLEKVIWLGG
jgi:retron-type reverse transcriptase